MSSTRSLRSRAGVTKLTMNADSIGATLRSRRSTRNRSTTITTVTVSRSPSTSPEGRRKSIRLTVKMPASKLREVTNGEDDLDKPRNIFTENVIMTGPRNSRSKRKVVEVDSDEDDDPSDIGDEEDEEDDEIDAEGDSDLDADGEPDIDAEGDIDMDDAPPVSPIAKQAASRPTVTVTPAAATKVRKTDSRATLEDDDDEEDEEEGLSELESDNDIGGQDDTLGLETNDDEPEEEEDEEDESDEELMGGSRSSTPDLSKMTRRQRGRIELGGDFLQLPMEPQVKKHLTAEEHAMRRAEMARRRKNLSEKRNEEEKKLTTLQMDTINKLLKKQAPKRRGKISAAEAAGESTPGQQEPQEPEKPDPTMIRCVINRNGYRIGVPNEWLGTPAGNIFGNPTPATHTGKLVEEI
ncbi:uncharacterized protein ARB_04842 [Trichophyton benhamiae CBS 112371]|uniref:INO80 complex subunit B-like conserved region domain-containing protein n=1 Tax=Arthroderma benhamiae (strain ATCC MYA-4681 / CBS 112371) TaxID=663331 RepID=D4AKJ9_ARTBC|nr:uncharacterized protein ARB_04842 [Trichophyton benhamiae CBS 112371]EFE35908.1 hypothetical protein ARB_04842 [Trichophyton benhamiae CBS 112371]